MPDIDVSNTPKRACKRARMALDTLDGRQSNSIQNLTDASFSALTSLERLHLQNNDIRVLPDEVFSHLTSLVGLYLQNNNISVLPDGVFSNLTSLEGLDLQNNDIRVLPDGVFSHLTSLVVLYLLNNDISVLPDGVFSNLTSLEGLDLQNNDIRVLPDGVFSHLTSLKWLYLQNNNISVLPDGVFSHLTSLRRLYLQNNNISVLSDGVFSHLTSLEWLYLQNNNISVLSDGVFSHLTSLWWLYLQNNDIRILSDGVFSHLDILERLDLENNNITVLPDEVFSHLTSLKQLDLANNDIRVLPDGVFSHLTSLKVLYLKNNNIRVLPDEVFSHLTSLEELALQNNNISVLPDGVFSHLTSLRRLYLQSNNISVLPDGVFSHLVSLEELYLQSNDIQNLTNEIFSTQTSVQILDLSNNRIKILPATVFSNLTRLTKLNLSSNSIQMLPAGITSLPPLMTLAIYGNPWRCDCILQGQMTLGNPTCSSPSHMEGVALEHVGKNTVCHGRGYCAPAEGTCDCKDGWTGPYCGKDNCCDSAIRIWNGQVNGDDSYCYGNVVQFTCDTGYELVGNSFAICQDRGWDRNFPTCQRICCDETSEITNGVVNATDGYCFGNNISFSCNPGYELVGRSLATCHEDGSWGQEIPTCQILPPTAGTARVRGGAYLYVVPTTTGAARAPADALKFIRKLPEEVQRPWKPNFQSPMPLEAIIAAGSSAGIIAALIVAAVVLTVFLRRRRKEREDSPVQIDSFLPNDVIIHNRRLQELAAVPLVPIRPEFPGFEVDPSRVTLGERIGSGAFGFAYRATLTTGDETEDVVVKTLKHNASEEDRLSFLQEIRAVVELGVQDNVLGLVACCTVVRDHLYLITEFMPYGDLKNFLRKCRQEEIYDQPRDDIYNFEVKQMYQVARQIARGMVSTGNKCFISTRCCSVPGVADVLGAEDVPCAEDILGAADVPGAADALGAADAQGAADAPDALDYRILGSQSFMWLQALMWLCSPILDPQILRQDGQLKVTAAVGWDHISRSRYIHGDLAARNVLVGEELKVKISDFGLAEDIYTRGYRRQDRLQRVPWKWMAPERLEGGKAYTSQSDVWSFGIVLYEISTLGGEPYPDVTITDLKDRLQAGFRMAKPEGCPAGMYDLMLQCWRWQPVVRPSFRILELDLDKQLAFYGPEYAITAPATETAPKHTAV
ncbi:Leucine-rich repeat-containing protein 15 [Branchiostoma belcheri]|nr:Leucine-rich repeat-containing protein 15 [Branchiostoma belcheri]